MGEGRLHQRGAGLDRDRASKPSALVTDQSRDDLADLPIRVRRSGAGSDLDVRKGHEHRQDLAPRASSSWNLAYRSMPSQTASTSVRPLRMSRLRAASTDLAAPVRASVRLVLGESHASSMRQPRGPGRKRTAGVSGHRRFSTSIEAAIRRSRRTPQNLLKKSLPRKRPADLRGSGQHLQADGVVLSLVQHAGVEHRPGPGRSPRWATSRRRTCRTAPAGAHPALASG